MKAVAVLSIRGQIARMNGRISWSTPTFSEVTKDSHENPQSGQLNSLIDSALHAPAQTHTYIVPTFQTRMAASFIILFFNTSMRENLHTTDRKQRQTSS
jgi:hypothetical protein